MISYVRILYLGLVWKKKKPEWVFNLPFANLRCFVDI